MSVEHDSRRDFIKRMMTFPAGLALIPFQQWADRMGEENLVRVTTGEVNIYKSPDRKSEVVMRRRRDDLLNAYYEVEGESGRNSRWYRLWGGFAHSGYLQPVKVGHFPALTSIPETGVLVEVSVPFTQTFRLSRRGNWEVNYRLYYGSVHWVIAVEEGPDGRIWYRVRDSHERIYYALAEHMRPIPDDELSPITPDIPRKEKLIEISISEQLLTAYENGAVVLKTLISSGVRQIAPLEPDQIPSDTPFGHHHITVKTPSRHMGERDLSADPGSGALPGVPWVCFIHVTGVALHGTYWHDNFGVRMSSGCINMRNEHAKWIYRWVQPFIEPHERQVSDWGTRVFVHE
jgi:lipoprotein-anchoring transpeptidase ErfK/SrfK